MTDLTGKGKPFHSALDKAAALLKRKVGTGAEFMKELQGLGGIKQAEIDERKLAELMGLPKMTHEQFMAALASKPAPAIREMMFGEPPSKEDIIREANKDIRHYAGEYASDNAETSKEYRQLYAQEAARLRGKHRGEITRSAKEYLTLPAHHEEYTIPGGENYREMLIKVPRGAEEFIGVQNHFGGEGGILASMRLKDRLVPDLEGEHNVKIIGGGGTSNKKFKTRAEAEAFADVKHKGGYRTEITPTQMKKLLHLEELQSDWHQQGREKGYKSNASEDEVRNAYNAQEHNAVPFDELRPEDRAYEIGKFRQSGVPDAPFKKNWEEMALKRLIHHAAEKGYHGIVVTPGMEQADRYSLAKHISGVDYIPDAERPHRNEMIAYDPKGNVIFNEYGMTPEKLEQHIGKEAAQKLLSQEAQPNKSGRPTHSLRGEQLVVGDKAMKRFYDEKVPNILNAIGKKHKVKTQLHGHTIQGRGRERTEEEFREATQNVPFERHKEFDYMPKPIPLHHFPITEEMRKDILTNGLPLYQEGGIIRKAEGGNVQIPVEQMRQQLMAAGRPLQDISKIGAEEAPDMEVKNYVAPAVGMNGQLPIGGVDMNPMQPGQQMLPANMMQPQPNPLLPQQPQAPQGPQAPLGGGSNILQMTPQGQKMAALSGSPQGNLPPKPQMAVGGSVPMPVNNHPFQQSDHKPYPFLAKEGGSDNAPMNNDYSDNGATDYNMDNIQQLKDGGDVSSNQYQDLLRRHLAGERLSKDQNMLLGLYHTISETKLKRPMHMMTASYAPDPKQPMVPEHFITPEDLFRGSGVPLIGDSTRGGQLLTHVDGKRFRKPVELQSGKDFMRVIRPAGENAGWASGTSVITDLSNKVKSAAEMADKVYGLHATMTGKGADFSSMPTKTLLEMIDRSKIDPSAMDAFDAEIKKFYPAFKGIRSPALRKQLLAPGAGELRKLFVTKMNLEPFQEAGFPDVAHARYAVQHPELLKRPLNSIGAAISELEPTGRVIKNPSMPHYDYPDHLAQNRYAGGFDVPMHRGEIFQDWERGRRESKASPSSDPRSFDLSTPIQKFDQEWLDKVMPIYLARRKALIGKKKGGDVKKAKLSDNLDTMRLALTKNSKKAK